MNFLSHRFSRLLISFVAFVLALGLSLGFSSIVHSADEATTEPPTTTEITSLAPEGEVETGKGWVVTSKSGKSEMSLAAHLKKTGAKVYNGWFCAHCYEQKQLFGREAVQASFVEVECNEQGINPQVALCQKKGIKGYPTWEIRGKKYPGVQSPEKLAQLSRYKGSKKFMYSKLLSQR
jgi:hypothetical protein